MRTKMMLMTRMMLMAGVAAAVFVSPTTGSAQSPSHEGQTSMKNIVETAVEAGSFTTLVAAVKAAGLAETLQGPGPFTVFAPSDAAFAKLPAGTIETLLADEAKLRSILTYHVVAGKVMADDIVKSNGATPTTVNGLPLDVVVRDGKVYVNGAQVVSADIAASNGVIHVIDAVLLPKAAPVGAGR
ncbi:MAG: fasciclin domain-containing protein [Gemmatimonadaceae bacterium]